ncbi:uncharacterized protein LOC120251286 [Dioscorea cayenensis subsp. rotundata]|uniref:Uncharacterized protein LOC120251286 n=1 Tax=Dioscorea cayennensis subsp. rotundata TaxID=55577 RepID=A0AB40ALJ2_DIOCR|nr:uncharacterized protein LOC120251286 [Dioscorea cayenensis subsp. rotundata]
MVMDVVGNVHDEGTNPNQQGVALSLIDRMERFEFVFILFLMNKDELLANVSKFCVENDIEMPNNMEERLLVCGLPRREKQATTYLHYYRVEVLDMIMQDMNSHFSKSTIELLSCISCLDPKLVRIAELYLENFSELDRMALVDQLEIYPLVSRLIELALVLLVSTASVERDF